jgi:5-methyltetrahydrofolate--homocysteine methyltransferase
MLIIGELINASRKVISQAIEDQDEQVIAKVAQNQFQAGAAYIDVNAGVFVDQEVEYLQWLVQVVQKAIPDAVCCLDSPNPEAIQAALSVHKGSAMINSISLEKDRWDNLLPLLKGGGLKVIALCMSDEGMPRTAEERVLIAQRLIKGLTETGVELSDIYVDPLVQPVSVDPSFGVEFLKAVELIMLEHPGVHTACGLSNISYGLPERKFLNQTFMTMAIAKGMDGVIINPLDKRMMANIKAAEALAGRDEFCMKYLQAYRAGEFSFD